MPDHGGPPVATRWQLPARSTKVPGSEGKVPAHTMKGTEMDEVYQQELSRAREALASGDVEQCFIHLERAHVLSQRMTFRHTHVHALMLVAGWLRGDWREVVGQLPRMLASLVFSRVWVPKGNTGRARVSAFQPMPVPEDLRHLVP